MAGFIYFTEEQKRRANEVNLESFLLRQGERLLKSGREKRLASDHSITVGETSGMTMQSRRAEELSIL